MTINSMTWLGDVTFVFISVLPVMPASVPAGGSIVLADNTSADVQALAQLAAAEGLRLIGNAEGLREIILDELLAMISG